MVKLFSILPFLSFVLMLSTPLVASEPAKNRPPNVVLILVDDLGWADLGCYGSTFHETPNLDALAKRGALFTDAYAASPVCSPTRASILSGKYPSRIGMSFLAGVSGPSGPSYKLIPPKVTGNIAPEDTTLAEALREHGYATAHIGKWHLQGHGEKGNAQFPEKHGFDMNIAGQEAGQPGSYHFPYKSQEQPHTDVRDMADGKEGDYLTDALTTKAIQFIADSADRPFFLNLWYYTVHTPIEPRKDKLEKYTAKVKTLDQTTLPPISEHQSLSRSVQNNPAYAAMVESLDENVGRLVDSLRSRGLEYNTIIVFTSDNGGLSTGPKATMPTCNLPLRAGKAWLYEGGIREPLLVSYPTAIKPGLRLTELVVSTDIFPTVLGLAGLPLLPNQHLDGVNLAPLLEGTTAKLDRQAIFFHLPHYHHINTMGPSGAVRAGDYKLIEVFETGKKELYNLKQDIGETKDLSEEKPELVEKLSKMLEEWRTSSGSQMATLNPNYDPEKDWRKVP
ncbi:MAG: Arylsulfatase [Verrucomicrobiota bacterium]|jgi:arylsulfatase A-like enzyme